MAGNVVELTDDQFEADVKTSDTPYLVDFWAPWCGPCRMITPVIEELATEMAGQVKFGKINIDDHQRTAEQFGVMSIPTLLVLKGGEVVERITGAYPKAQIKAHLDKHLTTA